MEKVVGGRVYMGGQGGGRQQTLCAPLSTVMRPLVSHVLSNTFTLYVWCVQHRRPRTYLHRLHSRWGALQVENNTSCLLCPIVYIILAFLVVVLNRFIGSFCNYELSKCWGNFTGLIIFLCGNSEFRGYS